MTISDYLTLPILINGISFYLLHLALRHHTDRDRLQQFSTGFFISGILQLAIGFHIVLTWPLYGVFNIAYGEPLVYFGMLATAFGFVLKNKGPIQGLIPFVIGGAFQCLVIGVAILFYSLSADPVIVGALFISVSIALFFAILCMHLKYSMRSASNIFLALAIVWCAIALRAYFVHLNPDDDFGKWSPPSMSK